MAGPLILVSNPGSASRKYALYDGQLDERARLHFEYVDTVVRCTLYRNETGTPVERVTTDLDQVAREVEPILRKEQVISDDEQIATIGLRVVAPSSFFTRDHIVDQEVIEKLESTQKLAPLHIAATLGELKILHEHFKNVPVVGVSDSNFHLTKPNYAWNYGIDIHDADQFDIKRFGYHGISVEGSIDSLRRSGKLPPKVVVCHLGSGSSVTAVMNGRSIDTTMGYSPLEGVLMSTRSGTIDPGAVHALRLALGYTYEQTEEYLNTKSGLLGLGGSNDIRELVTREKNGDHLAHLALATLVHTIQKAIGQMAAVLNGVDLLVFTGTVGERSSTIRRRVVSHLEYLDFAVNGDDNDSVATPTELTNIANIGQSKPIFVIPANESRQIAQHALAIIKDIERETD